MVTPAAKSKVPVAASTDPKKDQGSRTEQRVVLTAAPKRRGRGPKPGNSPAEGTAQNSNSAKAGSGDIITASESVAIPLANNTNMNSAAKKMEGQGAPAKKAPGPKRKGGTSSGAPLETPNKRQKVTEPQPSQATEAPNIPMFMRAGMNESEAFYAHKARAVQAAIDKFELEEREEQMRRGGSAAVVPVAGGAAGAPSTSIPELAPSAVGAAEIDPRLQATSGSADQPDSVESDKAAAEKTHRMQAYRRETKERWEKEDWPRPQKKQPSELARAAKEAELDEETGARNAGARLGPFSEKLMSPWKEGDEVRERPPGVAGSKKRGFVLKDAIGLDDEEMDDFLACVRRRADRCGLNINKSYSKQDPDLVPQVCRLIVNDMPYFSKQRFPGYWAVREALKAHVNQKRKYLNAKRKRKEEQMHEAFGQARVVYISDGEGNHTLEVPEGEDDDE